MKGAIQLKNKKIIVSKFLSKRGRSVTKFVSFYSLLTLVLILSTFSFHSKTVFASDNLRGIALKEPTHVYESKSIESKKLKSYAKGTILQYQSGEANWYKAVVYLNGKPRNGYIYKDDVETSTKNQADFKGVALKKPTKVYKNASTQSAYWKSYSEGSILQYRTFSKDWYEATVYVGGKARTGYIHKSHVEDTVSNQENLKGIGKINPTKVYKSASTSSAAWKSYGEGSILQYRTFSKNWYEATVIVKSRARTGYIHKSHVEKVNPVQQNLEGLAMKNPTNVYIRASRNSNVLKSYGQYSSLKFKTFSNDWYEATVYVGGKARIGYINVSDVASENVTKTTKYNYNLSKMVDAQLKTNPPAQTDLTKGNGWQDASRNQVEYYTHPSNFSLGSPEYYQFLVLSHPVGVSAADVNREFLNNTGVLTGKAQVFINAAKAVKINELYLVAHALLETGRGTSPLATGISEWTMRNAKCEIITDKNGKPVKKNIAPKKVYNMYGVGAYDKCAVDAGAQRAYEEGWYSIDTAIEKGAVFAGKGYIQNGQDTLYKMRWNPERLNNSSSASHQYATDVGWAAKQTKTIYNMYEKLAGKHILTFDVPQFVNQASSPKGSTEWKGTVKPNPGTDLITVYPSKVYGVTNTSGNLNFRSTPSTANNGNVIGSIPSRSKIEIIGTNGSWYQAKYGNRTGWVHSSYVDLLNLLEVTVTDLNVRETPNGKVMGSVSKELIAAVLDKNNNIVRDKEWYKIYYNNKEAWISGGTNGTQYIKVKK